MDVDVDVDEELDPDPRVRWLQDAYLAGDSPKASLLSESSTTSPSTHGSITSSLLERMKDLLLYHRSNKKTDEEKFCSWMGQEAYIKALVKVDPSALTNQDEITGMYAFQLAALREGDLDSGYHLLRMAPHIFQIMTSNGMSEGNTSNV